ncbi:MAG: nucleotide pyrophosphohydrolase [Paludibacteraceae bacterium]|jgi:NTP pyrophosphatase (non-canonical NTP hydrolase)|nr:nucleotide pyrophosphohydrolase [Paludibacteraceae bacterium]MEE0912606.1 nucleotide pyrophosphohydrolase [Paludibacteraceae bacterium]
MSSLKDIQSIVDSWIKQYGVRYFSELTNTAILMEEVGELARVMARKYGDQSSKESDLRYSLEDEMADVLWVLVCLANQTGVDLDKAFQANLNKKTKRDALRHINNDKLK